MATCETYQSQLLDYLYELLEPAEAADMRQHLEQCTACQAALARAQAHQKVLARAAKSRFPAVRFQPPTEVVPSPGPAEVVPMRRRGVNWGAWAVAASILLLLGGLGTLG